MSALEPVEETAVSFDRVAEEALGPAIQQQWLDRIAWRSFIYYPRLRKARRYVEEHLHEKLTVRDVARVACCEYKYFSSYFHAKVNVTFTDWVRLIRVAEAARLLRAEDMTMYQAARQAGFSDLRARVPAFLRRDADRVQASVPFQSVGVTSSRISSHNSRKTSHNTRIVA